MIKNFFFKSIKENIILKNKIKILHPLLDLASTKIYQTLKKKRKVYICGNGGSAADAQHLAAEFLVRLNKEVNRKPLPIVSLALDTSTITACSNDYGFDYIFSRNLEALYSPGDLLITISTSGNSNNILNVLKFAKKKKLFSISLLGDKGGLAKSLSRLPIIIPSCNVARIQECHIFIGHVILDFVEKKFNFKKK
jgi:D-sedoheptulose 7-phosphate isomerase